MLTNKAEVIKRLQQDILHLQGFKSKNSEENLLGLGPVEAAFPNGIFATGAIHEFVSQGSEETAATFGFVSAVLSKLMTDSRPCIWVCPSRSLFPLALKKFNIEPAKIIFIETATDAESLWVMEEALKCDGIAVVIGEIPKVSFSQSRRLQLAVEKSKVTGFLLRAVKIQNMLASIARWRIVPVPSVSPDGIPGVGFPQWEVELLKVRNGKPGSWKVAWMPEGFRVMAAMESKELSLSDNESAIASMHKTTREAKELNLPDNESTIASLHQTTREAKELNLPDNESSIASMQQTTAVALQKPYTETTSQVSQVG